jgi:hypothetical protein
MRARVWLAMLGSLVASLACAQPVFKCQAEDGSIAYQEHPCPDGAEQQNLQLGAVGGGEINPVRSAGLFIGCRSTAALKAWTEADARTASRMLGSGDCVWLDRNSSLRVLHSDLGLGLHRFRVTGSDDELWTSQDALER